MNIAFRVDGYASIGLGHLMRCLVLASELRKEAHRILFIGSNETDEASNLVKSQGYDYQSCSARENATVLDEQADAFEVIEILSESHWDWLVVDHYQLGEIWESTVRPSTNHILVIDDLANRRHDCDVLLDQNYCAGFETRYVSLIDANTVGLYGPKYALLRAEFQTAAGRRTAKPVKEILICFGGSDPENATMWTLQSLEQANLTALKFKVVVGAANPHLAEIQNFCQQHEAFKCYASVDDIAHMMKAAQLAIGASGTMNWERCSMGLPALIFSLAENQDASAQALHEAGISCFLGRFGAVSSIDFQHQVWSLINDTEKLFEMSARASALVDGNGAHRVASVMLEMQR